MIKKGFLLALFAIGVFANIFAQDTLSFKKTRDKNIYIEFLGASNLIGVSFDSRFTPISPWGYRIGISYFQGGDSFIKASNSNRGLFFPIEVNFLTSGNKHKLELGLGSNLGKIQYIAHTISPTILNSIITNVFSFFLNTCQRSTEYLSRAKGKKYRTSEASTGDFLPGE